MNNIFTCILLVILLTLLLKSLSLPSSSPSIIEIQNNIKTIKANITTAVEAQDYHLAASLKTKLTELVDKLSKAIKFEAAISNEFPLPNELYNKSYTIYNNNLKNLEVKYGNDINMIMVYIKYFLLMAADRGCSFVAFSPFKLGWPIVLFQDGFTMNFSDDWASSIKEQLRLTNLRKQNYQAENYKDQLQNLNTYQERLKNKLSTTKEMYETLTEPINILSSPISQLLSLLIEWKLVEMGYLIGQGYYGKSEGWLVVSLWPFTEPQCKSSYIKFNALQYADIDSFPFEGNNYQRYFQKYQEIDYLHTLRSINFIIRWNYNATGGVFNDDDDYY